MQVKTSMNGTSRQGTVCVSYNRLVEVFGPPHDTNGDKSTVEWAFEDNGVRFTLYDYYWRTAKNDCPENFHIGGDDYRAVEMVWQKLGID